MDLVADKGEWWCPITHMNTCLIFAKFVGSLGMWIELALRSWGRMNLHHIVWIYGWCHQASRLGVWDINPRRFVVCLREEVEGRGHGGQEARGVAVMKASPELMVHHGGRTWRRGVGRSPRQEGGGGDKPYEMYPSH